MSNNTDAVMYPVIVVRRPNGTTMRSAPDTRVLPDRTASTKLPDGLMKALRQGDENGVAQMDALWNATPFDVTMRDPQNHGLLHLALSLMPYPRPAGVDPHAVFPTVAWLLDHGAPVDVQSTQGITVLAQAEALEKEYPATVVAIRTALRVTRIAQERTTLEHTMDDLDGPSSIPRARL